MKGIITLAFLILLISSTIFADSNNVISKIKLHDLTKQQYLIVAKGGYDIVERHQDTLIVMATSRVKARLDNLSISYDIDIEDMSAFYRSRVKDKSLTMGGFMTLSEIESWMDFWVAAYPSILIKFSIGTSLEGRTIWAYKISDNPEIDEDEPEVGYFSLTHAREPASASSLIYFIEHLVNSYGYDSEVTDIVDNRELFFVLVVNTDGYYWNEFTDPAGGGMWRKNRKYLGVDEYGDQWGVDLNRNYGFQWGFDDYGSSWEFWSETYRGTAPFSEPETQVIRDFIISRNFIIMHNNHSYSNLEIWPYGYDRIYSHQEDFYINLGDSLTQYNGYAPGIGWTLYPTNGDFDDWAWGDTLSKPRIISLTAEIGNYDDGFWPDPARIPTLNAENVFPNLFIAKIADNPYKIAPPFPPDFLPPPKTLGNYNIEWTHIDTANPAVTFALTEYTDKVQYVDDAETASSNDFWDVKRLSRTTSSPHSGSYCWITDNENGKGHWLLSKSPYFVKEDDSLRFWISYSIELEWDYFYAQVSTDGGYTFDNLANNMTTNNDPWGRNLGNGITGFSSGWVFAKFDLAEYIGKEVLFRLSYMTDGWILEDGVRLDGIENIEMFTNQTVLSNSITDTTFSIANNPNGDYWYRLTATDIDNQTSRDSKFMKVNVLNFLTGDVTGDFNVDVDDLIALVDYAFKFIIPPFLEAGDVDCNLIVDVDDLIYMVDYAFKGGPAPNCP